MKKIIYLILGVLLFIPTLVKADGAGPGIISYKATPKSKDGAVIYCYDDNKEDYVKSSRKLEYGKTITITWEDDYIEFDPDDDCVVKFDDLVPIEKNYKVNEKDLAKAHEALVIQKMEIKKGPAGGYEGTGKFIPVGAKIKVRFFQYYDKEIKDYVLEYSNWAYVEYNGTKGFIDTEGSLALDGTYTTAITLQDSEIVDVSGEKIIATIKANTNFNAKIYELGQWSYAYYIEYGSIKGILGEYEIFPKRKPITFKPTQEIKVYQKLEYNDEDEIISKVVTTIPKGTSFQSNYYWAPTSGYSITVYYEKDNIKGWIKVDETIIDPDDPDSDSLTPEEILGFSYPKDNGFVAVEKKDTDNSHNPITILKTPIKIDNGEDEEEDVERQGDTGETPTPTPIDKSDAPKTDEKTGVKKTIRKVPMLVYYCLAAAVIVSLTAVVTVLLVNKKKKKVTTDEPKEEVKEETTEEEKEKVE